MNRRQIIFVVILNALISLVVALAVVWAVEARRPDPEELAILQTPNPQVVTLSTPDPASNPNAPIAEAPTAVSEAAEPTAAPTATLDPANQQIYTIQSGDSLSAVAGRFGTTVDAIMQANELTDPNVIFVGQRLIIPVGNGGNSAAPAENAPATAAPLTSGEGLVVRTVDGAGALVSEAVQIVNDSNTVIDLSGWRLERENGPAYTFGSQSIFPGGNLWLHSGGGTDTTVALYWNQSEPVWQSGAVVRLVNAEGNVVNRYTVP